MCPRPALTPARDPGPVDSPRVRAPGHGQPQPRSRRQDRARAPWQRRAGSPGRDVSWNRVRVSGPRAFPARPVFLPRLRLPEAEVRVRRRPTRGRVSTGRDFPAGPGAVLPSRSAPPAPEPGEIAESGRGSRREGPDKLRKQNVGAPGERRFAPLFVALFREGRDRLCRGPARESGSRMAVRPLGQLTSRGPSPPPPRICWQPRGAGEPRAATLARRGRKGTQKDWKVKQASQHHAPCWGCSSS